MDACTLVGYMYAGRMHACWSRACWSGACILVACIAWVGPDWTHWMFARSLLWGQWVCLAVCLRQYAWAYIWSMLVLACPRIGTRPRTCMDIAPTLALMIAIALHWHCICIGTHVCACICIVGRTGHCLMPHWHCICVYHLVADVCNCVCTWVAIALAMEVIAVL